MIHLVCPAYSSDAGIVVEAALQRSFTATLVQKSSFAPLQSNRQGTTPACWVLINPPDSWVPAMQAALQAKTKIILLGTIPTSLSSLLQAQLAELPEHLAEAAQCCPAPPGSPSESPACIRYRRVSEHIQPPLEKRPFVRFDFADEWNNQGYGAIKTDDSVWSVSQLVQIPDQYTVAEITIDGRSLSAYAGLWDFPASSLLWFNRPVGPVDSQEWRLIEQFLAHHRHDNLPCWPVIREVPHGYDAAVTMRLDCDEDVESARGLRDLYQQLDVPLSLALHTSVLSDPRHHQLPQEVLAHNGAILSHTATHAPNWGGSYEAAYAEGSQSAEVISRLIGKPVRYAVSPFHHTPDYARAGLADAGYCGCIGGIIHNDPDFLMARAGVPPGGAQGFIGHSQQCMLHGDCLLDEADPLRLYKAAFDLAKAGKSVFGYLDHPFSERYSYGWQSEAQRAAMHAQFVAYIKQTGRVLFCNQEQAMDFLLQKSAIRVVPEQNGFRIIMSDSMISDWQYTVEYAGTAGSIPADGVLS